MKVSIFFILSLITLPLILASQDELVVKLTRSNFDSVINGGGDWFIKLYY